MMPFEVDALPAVPWKNGGGTTRNLMVLPEGAGFEEFDWRVSIADVQRSGEFSLFAGVDRGIALLEGHGMTLNGQRLTVAFEPYNLSGDTRVEARLVNGPARDFNAMVRRSRGQSEIGVWRSGGQLTEAWSAAVFYCARGDAAIGKVPLMAGMALCFRPVPAGLRIAPAAPDAIVIGALLKLRNERWSE